MYAGGFSDVLCLLAYVAVLQAHTMPWVITGFHLALQQMLGILHPRVAIVSLLQVSNTCLNQRVRVAAGPMLGISLLSIMVALASRGRAFSRVPTTVRGAAIICVYTAVLAVHNQEMVDPVFDTVRVALFLLVNHVQPDTVGPWTLAARTGWILACHFRLLLGLALLQAIFDADVKEDTRKALDKEIETWDLRMV
tara:strand:+ start:1780 stop:2364 length:585 start_codon:yes stop_codon:yes gene_type:complete